jgi:vacuolar-type H+-ATPase subunit H
MSEANEDNREIDQIHESEKAAHERIETAEAQARAIRDEADKEVKALMAKAEYDAKNEATSKLSDIEGKKENVEAQVLGDTDEEIKALRKRAEKKKEKAAEAVYKILVEDA